MTAIKYEVSEHNGPTPGGAWLKAGSRGKFVEIDLWEKGCEIVCTGNFWHHAPFICVKNASGTTNIRFHTLTYWEIWCSDIQSSTLRIAFIKP